MVKKRVLDILYVVVGNLLLAFGISAFAVPANLIVGGATGVGLIVEKSLHIDYATVVFIINIVMLILGYFKLGKEFALGTVASTFIYPICLKIFENVTITNDILLSTIYAGVLMGLGLGIVFRRGFSTGGLDIPPLILHQYYQVPLGFAVNAIDAVILLGQVSFTDVQGVLYGLISTFISSYVIHQVSILGESHIQILIISSHYEEIAQAILDKTDRGCSLVHLTTGYLHQPTKAVMCVANRRQNAQIKEIVLAIDKDAFIVNQDVYSIHGRGFTLPNIEL